ncbi:CBM96 family carbohydrate-binding protein [Kribbella monticola]|uniref:CBM96 family carbohydrate-binding protein n=1 Tax=Kribbella monticola TaxID=2185285 RepID=UPI0013007A1A|nr:hypothetical protein [Kribbella monticola]
MRDEISRRQARHRAAVPSDVLNEPAAKAGRRTLIPIVAAIAILLGTTGLGFAALNQPAKPPAPVQLSATADAYISSKSPTQRHGWSARLVAKANEASILLRYTVPAATSGFDRKATLVLHRLTRGTPGKITAATGPSGWAENVTYATAPKAAGTPIATVADDGTSAELRIDVSAAVTDAGVLNLALTQTDGSNYAVFGARESGLNQSKLEISYVPEGDGPTPSMPTSAPTKPTTSVPTSTPTVVPTKPTATPTTTTTTTKPPTTTPTTTKPTSTPTAGPGCTVSALLVPSCGAWFGAAANPLGSESWDAALPAFESTIGRTVDIAHYYNSSPKLFPTADMIKRAREPGKKRMLLLNWKPEMGRTWAQVAAGDPTVDAAIDAEAKYLKSTFPEKFFLGIHHEPEDEVKPAAGSGMTAKDYRAMYRHVALRLKADGVTNAVFVMNYMGTPHWGSQSWFADLYPGDDVVDWIAEDPYIFGTSKDWWTDFASAVDRKDTYTYPNWPGFYTWATTKHPGKPIMLGEWGVNEQTTFNMSKSDVLNTVNAGLAKRPAIKALVYWNETKFNPVGETRLDSSSAARSTAQQVLGSGSLLRRLN